MSARLTITGDADIIKRLRELDNKLRSKTLREIGRDLSKAALPVMKAANRRRTGGLIKAHGSKVKVYRSTTLVVVIGPRTSIHFARISPRKVKRLKVKKGVVQGKAEAIAAKQYYRPSRIAHLAGPGRKSTVLPRVAATVKPIFKRIIEQHFQELARNAR